MELTIKQFVDCLITLNGVQNVEVKGNLLQMLYDQMQHQNLVVFHENWIIEGYEDMDFRESSLSFVSTLLSSRGFSTDFAEVITYIADYAENARFLIVKLQSEEID